MTMDRDLLVDSDGASLHGSCSHCRRHVDNRDDLHRVSAIMRGGRGVECVLRGDIHGHEAGPLRDERQAPDVSKTDPTPASAPGVVCEEEGP